MLAEPTTYVAPGKYVFVPSLYPLNVYPVLVTAVPTAKLCPMVNEACVGAVEPLET